MDSRAFGPGHLVLGLALRAALAAALIVLLILDLAVTRHYATALVLGLLLGFVLFEAAHRYGASLPAAAPAPALHPRQQARLAQAEALLDAVSVALITLQADGRITLANRAARLLAGQEAARLADVRALGPDAIQVIAALPVGARQIVTTADGRPMLVWVAAFAAEGQPVQRLVSLQAVTGELDAVQLKAWMDMSRVLSHEIMNSLTPIASLSESLGRMLPPQPGDATDAIAAIGRRSQHLMSFVERYRRIADLPAPAPATVPAAALLADIETLIRPALAARGIAWHCTMPPPTLLLHADPALLSQALINLLRNAADAAAATSAPQPLVTFAAAHEDGKILLTVSDNGPGIAPQHRQEIFLPFFTTKEGGSGIGLTLARQIALAHGGQLSMANIPEGGIRFCLTLPMASESTG